MKRKNTPAFPLREVKRLAREKRIRFEGVSAQTALNDFGWGPEEIIACLQKLNCRFFILDPERNHFHKSEPHRDRLKTDQLSMDYYKAKQIMDGYSIYTHFYIENSELRISSFKRL